MLLLAILIFYYSRFPLCNKHCWVSYSVSLLRVTTLLIWQIPCSESLYSLAPIRPSIYSPLAIRVLNHPNFPLCKAVLDVLFCQLPENPHRFCFDRFHYLKACTIQFRFDLYYTSLGDLCTPPSIFSPVQSSAWCSLLSACWESP